MTPYDPFAYGQVPLNPKEQSAAPDDLLFADATPVKATPASESDWAPPSGGFGSAFENGASADDALAFGADILGEAAPAAPAKARPAAAPAPAPAAKAPASAPAAKAAAAAPVAKAPTLAPVAKAPTPVHASAKPAAPFAASPAASAPSRPVARPVMPMPPRRSSAASVFVPIAAVAVGGAAAWWLFAMQHNPVMAGIVGLATLVGATLAGIVLRR
jgi:hypothetical protein